VTGVKVVPAVTVVTTSPTLTIVTSVVNSSDYTVTGHASNDYCDNMPTTTVQ